MELSIGLIVVGVLTAAAINGIGGFLQARMVQLSNTRLTAAADALTLFVTRNKRLPCPADGTLPDTSSTAGTEAFADGVTSTNCAGAVSIRVLPWRALGLGAVDGRDGFATPPDLPDAGWRNRPHPAGRHGHERHQSRRQ